MELESNDRFPNINDDVVNVVLQDGLTPLMNAILDGDNDHSLELIARGVDVNGSDNYGRTALLFAAEHDNKEIAKLLIEEGALLNASDHNCQTALIYAAKHNNEEVIKLLIEKGASVNRSDYNKYAALMFEARYRNEKNAKMLIEMDGRLNASDYNGQLQADLMIAAKQNKEIAEQWIEIGAGGSVCDKLVQTMTQWQTDLMIVAKQSKEIAERLIEKSALFNATDYNGQAALMIAAKHNEFAERLIEIGHRVSVSDKYAQIQIHTQTALMFATKHNNEEIAKLLIERGADVNSSDIEGKTALLFAAANDNEEITKLLIEKGAVVNVCDEDKHTPLMIAAKHNNEEIAKLLIEKGADVNVCDEDKHTPLMIAAKDNNEEIAKLLIEKDADVNVSDKYEQTALVFAIEHNNEKIAKLLIEKGAYVNVSDSSGKTALMIAAEHDNEEIAKMLIEKGANVNVSDIDEQTALVFAIEHNNEKIAKLLIEKGAYVNVSDYFGKTALMYAAEHNNEEIAKLLIQKGADVNVSEMFGETALMIAAKHKNEEIAKMLIEKGADVNVSDGNETALIIAAKHNNEKIAKLLIEKGADVHARYINQETVLFNAVRKNTNMIEILVDHGKADVNTRNVFGETPLFYAFISKFALQTVPLLLGYGAKINDTDSCDFSVLSFYIEHQCNNLIDNEVEILDIFIEKGIQLEKVFSSTINIMYSKFPSFFNSKSQSHSQNFASKAITILKNYAYNEKQTKLIKTLEMHLTGELLDDKLLESLDVLIQLGANPNSVDTEGNTALHYTVQLPFFGISEELTMEIVLKLENHGARLDNANHQSQTPLMFCLTSWDRDNIALLEFNTVQTICRHFLKRAPPIRQNATRNGESVFHLLMKLFHEVLFIDDRQTRERVLCEMSELLKLFCPPDIVKGVAVNKTDDKLKSPLHLWASLHLASNDDYAKSISRELTFENLLKIVLNHLHICGVKLNIRDAEDQTSLHHCRTWSAFKCLVEAGAKRNDHDSRGRPPLLAAAHNSVFMKNQGQFFPDVTDDPKSFFQSCVEMDLDLWAFDNDNKSVLSLLLASETYILAKALVEVACEFKPSVLEQLLTVICQDKSTHTLWKSSLVEMILPCTDRPPNNLNPALRNCCLNVLRLYDKEGRVTLEKEKEDDDEQPTRKVKTDDSSGCREDLLPSSVHLDIARQLLLYGADGESCTDLCADFPKLHSFLTEEIDLSQIPLSIRIPWTSYSTKHEAKLRSVARRQNFEQIGTYLFHQEPIGSGSFGHVFAGINEKDGREIAIKKIEKLRMVRPEEKREIGNLTALAHCQEVVTYIYFDDSEKNFVYIVLELMEGHLDEYFASSCFHQGQSSLLCKNVVMGLKDLHDRKPNPILHRDLKPSNILYKVHPKICLKIADFGLSSSMTTTGTTVLGTNVGTRCWIAPEVIRSDTYQHSMASDNYSCGLLLHYILSLQKHPFSPADCSNKTREFIDFETQNNMLRNTMEGWDDKLSPEATHLIKSLLSSNVTERPSAADSLTHPLFWSNKKKIALLTAVGNQPEIECPRPASGPLGAVESDLEAKFSRIVQHSTWDDARFTHMPSIYAEITKPIAKGKGPPRKPRLYNTRSVVELIRFIRNSIAHVSDAHRTSVVRKQILEDAVFLVELPQLVIEVFKVVTKHGWDTREEIKHAMSSE